MWFQRHTHRALMPDIQNRTMSLFARECGTPKSFDYVTLDLVQWYYLTTTSNRLIMTIQSVKIEETSDRSRTMTEYEDNVSIKLKITVYYAFLWKIQCVTRISVYVVTIYGKFWLKAKTILVISSTFPCHCIFSVMLGMFDLKYYRLEQDFLSFKVYLTISKIFLVMNRISSFFRYESSFMDRKICIWDWFMYYTWSN